MSIQETVRTGQSVEERNKKTIRRVFDAFVNQGDFSVVDEIYSPDMVDHQPLPGAPEGLEGVRYTIAGLREGFPDLHVTIEDMSAHGDHVVIHNTWRGTHLGDFLGAAPTKQVIEFTGVVVWRLLDNGLIAERWGIGVESNMLAVLGMRRLAPAARTAARAAARRAVTGACALLPLTGGAAEGWRRLQAELAGPRLHAYEASRRRAGILRESFDLRPLDGRDVLVHQIEARDPQAAARRLLTSADPFDHWLREQATAVLGTDPWTRLADSDTTGTGHTWASVTSELAAAD
ncbi:ester cyclase [Streptomyces sp. RPA4-2]|uniref:ester cyclase n=1 Tax=Streptomyces sp. RPA4-2 TaxID=2721244 RepID=UPI00143ED9A0|nr:ester cyclase [Streptomyces sp. RPA4-2]QIY60582.1 ester cyclase [Streptomyces sp. RPA4-2]